MTSKHRTVAQKNFRAGTPPSQTSKVGKRGTVVIPSRLRRRFGFEEGSLVIAEEAAEGVLIRPAAAVALEIYSPERQAEFLLSNAVDARDYERVSKLVRRMGLDPDVIPHRKPRPRP
jgi:AbrB family looped-hinge helix DNA binding protein